MKADSGLMMAIVAGGAFAVGMAVAKIASAQRIPAGTQGLVNLDFARRGTGAAIAWQERTRRLNGWGTPGFSRGTGSAIYWRRVS